MTCGLILTCLTDGAKANPKVPPPAKETLPKQIDTKADNKADNKKPCITAAASSKQMAGTLPASAACVPLIQVFRKS